MQVYSFLRRVVALVVLLIASGCISVPEQDLAAYRSAYAEAQSAGDLLYDEISALIARRGKTAGGSCPTANGVPSCFEPASVASGGRSLEDPAIQARRAALDIIATYNIAIAELAEGKSAEALERNVGELTGLARDLASLASIGGGLPAFLTGPALGSLGAMAERLDLARARAAVRQSLLAERATIEALIDELIADTPRMYDIYLIGQGDIASNETTPEGVRREFGKIAKYHESLAAYVRLLRQTKESLGRLVASLSVRGNGVAEARTLIRETTELRRLAEDFWNTVRDVRS